MTSVPAHCTCGRTGGIRPTDASPPGRSGPKIAVIVIHLSKSREDQICKDIKDLKRVIRQS